MKRYSVLYVLFFSCLNLCLKPLLSSLPEYYPSWQGFPSYKICTWYHNKSAAVSLTFDDNNESQFAYILPLLDRFRFNATFFVVTGALDKPWSVVTWDSVRMAASRGHEIGSHTVNHPRLIELDEVSRMYELEYSRNRIDEEVPGQKCVSLAYPYSQWDDELRSQVSSYYIVARAGDNWSEPADPPDLYTVHGNIPLASTSLEQMNCWIDEAVVYRLWCVEIVHTFEYEGAEPLSADRYRLHLRYIKSKEERVWVAPLGTVAKYIRERDAATIIPVSVTDSTLSFDLSDGLPDSVYNVPLTIAVDIPGDWENAEVTQAGMPRWSAFAEGNSGRTLLVDAVPDAGEIAIHRMARNSQRPNPPSVGYELSVFPNPVRCIITAIFAMPEKNEAQLDLFDIRGCRWASFKSERWLDSGEYFQEFDLRNFPSGVYFLRFRAGGSVSTVKIVVQR